MKPFPLSIDEPVREPAAVDGRSAPFSAAATVKDVYYCFRLLLGRHPHPEEWRGHTMRVGEELGGVVASFANSLECVRRGIFAPSGAAAVLTEIEGFRIYTDPDDALVGGAVRAGSYEPEVCATFRRLLRPGMSVLDLGANVGFFAMLAASLVGPRGRVLAVEPNPRNARLLEASRRANGFAHVDVLQAAAGCALGLLELNSSYSNGTTSGLADDVASVLSAETVAAVPLDALIPADRPVAFIKVDVEGAEHLALRGCEAAIRRDRPVIVTEFSPALLPGISGVDGPGYLRWLTGLGYDLSVIRLDGEASPVRDDVEAVMRALKARGSDHLDLVAEPREN